MSKQENKEFLQRALANAPSKEELAEVSDKYEVFNLFLEDFINTALQSYDKEIILFEVKHKLGLEIDD